MGFSSSAGSDFTDSNLQHRLLRCLLSTLQIELTFLQVTCTNMYFLSTLLTTNSVQSKSYHHEEKVESLFVDRIHMSWECRFNLRRRETDIYLKNVGTFPKHPFEIPSPKEGRRNSRKRSKISINNLDDIRPKNKIRRKKLKFFICSTRKKYSNSIPSGVIEGHPKQWQHTSSSQIFFDIKKAPVLF